MEPCRQKSTIDMMKVTLNSINHSIIEHSEALENIKTQISRYEIVLDDFKKELTGEYSPQELKATLDFFVSLGRVFVFFQKYKAFAVILGLMIMSALSGIGVIDIIEWFKMKGIWFI